MRTIQVAVVHWLDAYASENHEAGVPGAMQVSAGILLERTKTHVKLAQIVDHALDGGCDPARDVLTIPRGMVQKIRIVYRERRKKSQ